ncbi:MAG: fucose isomerase [Armatimonadetes bacterium]|nr:fucose isomerase [Armatimonadota bacterium]
MEKRVLLAASGDLRPTANQVCWQAQHEMEQQLMAVLSNRYGVNVERIHQYDNSKGHGFLDSQRAGLEAFSRVDPTVPIIVAESVWQYSHHVLPGLLKHKGPILTVANWSGQWPGLVGMLNLNASLTKAGRAYTTTWSEDFQDYLFHQTVASWLNTGSFQHDESHVAPYNPGNSAPEQTGRRLAQAMRSSGMILGVFDEGCMGMYNAIIPDELLFPMGIYKERLSQSALLYAMSVVPQEEAEVCLQWIESRGFNFHFGADPKEELTREQVLSQCRMYLAAARMADEMGCDALGIQYQQGLKDMCPASDLVEGLLNNAERPPITRPNGSLIRDGEPYVHFNEVDECAGVDGILTLAVNRALGQPLESTLHDLRWGDKDRTGTTDEYVWVFEISGGAPPAHHVGGYAGSHGYRQPSMYFPSGGATCSGISHPGEIVWSRIYVDSNGLNMDIGRGRSVELPAEETQRRLDATTPVWPVMNGVLDGVTRDQMMARHKSNHIQVTFAHDASGADDVLRAKSALAAEWGIRVHWCGLG